MAGLIDQIVDPVQEILLIEGLDDVLVGTGLLLEWIDLGAFAVGVALQCVYLAFAVAVVGLAASIVRKTVSTAVKSCPTTGRA